MSPGFESQRTRSTGAHPSQEQNGTTELNSCTLPFWARRLRFNYHQANWMGFKRARDRRGGGGEEEKLHALHIPLFMSFPNAFSTAIYSEGDRKHFRSECKNSALLKRGRRKTNTNVRSKIDCDKRISIKRDGIT